MRTIPMCTAILFLLSSVPATIAGDRTQIEASDVVSVAAGAGDFKTLSAAIEAAGLADALRGPGPFTVFAPTDAAFAALPAGTLDSLLLPENRERLVAILRHHVLSGRLRAADVVGQSRLMTLGGQSLQVNVSDAGVQVGGARVTTADIDASNGVIHVIDEVLLPADRADIVDTAVGAGSFGTLVKAVQAAGLEEALRGAGPFTVFAPSDAAFAKLDPATLASLLEPRNREKLAGILKFHVVAGAVESSGLKGTTRVKTLNGQELEIVARDGKVSVNGAQVTGADVMAGNGVIHVIDAVLLPE
jgi:uncharacterized surface protein with fasciclin (FAS1) repeats